MNRDFTFYDLATGELLRSTRSIPHDWNIADYTPEGQGAIEGLHAPTTPPVSLKTDRVIKRAKSAAAAAQATMLRALRDECLRSSDWTQLPDAPLSDAQRARWREYRQALRDAPATKRMPEPPKDRL